MIIVDCKQYDPVWMAARIGIPTCSNFDKLLAPKKLEPSKSADGYLWQLLAEWLVGHPLESGSTAFMSRGSELEDQAVDWYMVEKQVDVKRVGFILHDNRMCGGSPDGLVDAGEGGIEIKCLSLVNHVEALCATPDVYDYRLQIQGYMWLTGAKWWDRVYFHPELPPVILHVERDLQVIAAIEETVVEFVERIEHWRKWLVEVKGCTPRKPQTLEDLERARAARNAADERAALEADEFDLSPNPSVTPNSSIPPQEAKTEPAIVRSMEEPLPQPIFPVSSISPQEAALGFFA